MQVGARRRWWFVAWMSLGLGCGSDGCGSCAGTQPEAEAGAGTKLAVPATRAHVYEQLPPAPALPPPVEPALGRTFDLDYRGAVSLDRSDPELTWLVTEAELGVTPKGEPLERLDLAPGLWDASVRPEFGWASWEWHLTRLDSDRPLRVEANTWRLSLLPDAPVPPGRTWTVKLTYRSAISRLEPPENPMKEILGIGEFELSRYKELFDLFDNLLSRFMAEAATWSFVAGDFHVLMPPWPLVLDCGGRSEDGLDPVRDCVARGDLPARVEVRVPGGWKAVLPHPSRTVQQPQADGRVEVVDRLPQLLVLSPGLVRERRELAGRMVELCAPPGRAGDLDELALLVERALPALEARLGPYPHQEPLVCLSPLPVDYGGLAMGRLALVKVETFASLGLEDETQQPGSTLVDKLKRLLSSGHIFANLREELVLHELAHHWWKTELPSTWQSVLMEGAATFVAKHVQHELHPDPERRYFVDASPWLSAAQLELAGVELPSLHWYLEPQVGPLNRAEPVLAYVHGLTLFERSFLAEDGRVRWDAVRALHHRAPPVVFYPETLLARDPRALQVVADMRRRDQRVRASDHVDVIQHASLQSDGWLDVIADEEFARAIRAARALADFTRKAYGTILRRALGVDQAVWAPAGEVLSLMGQEQCVQQPEDSAEVASCWKLLQTRGPGELASIMDLDAVEMLCAHERDPDSWESWVAKKRTPGQIRKQALGLLKTPAAVTDDQAKKLEGDRSLAEARADLLLVRIHARWAAQAYLNLIASGARPPALPPSLVQETRDYLRDNPREIQAVVGTEPVGGPVMIASVRDDRPRAVPIGVVAADSPAGRAGLRSFDYLLEVCGQPVDSWPGIAAALRKNGSAPINLEAVRLLPGGSREVLTLDFKPAPAADAPAGAFSTPDVYPGFESADLYIRSVLPDGPADRAGLRAGDKLIAMDGEPLRSWEELPGRLTRPPGDDVPEIAVTFRRQGRLRTVGLRPVVKLTEEDGQPRRKLFMGVQYPLLRAGDKAGGE